MGKEEIFVNRLRKRVLLISVFCLLVVLAGGCFFYKEYHLMETKQSKQTETDTTSSRQETIDQIINDSHFKGTVLLIDQQTKFYEKSYGYADVNNKYPNKIEGIFPIASLQKIITGAIILTLVKDGKLELDATLDKFYPQIDFSQTITIQQLLDHRSGISMAEEAPKQLLINEESQLENALDTLTVTHNKEFDYTNGNYTLLAGIIAQITGQSYEMVVKKWVIDPLSLTQTYFWDQLPTDEITPQPYFYTGQDYQDDPYPASKKLFSSLLGAGNLYMSAEDFWLVIQGLADGRLFQQREYEQLADIDQEGYRAGLIYFDDLKYSQGSLGGYETAVYGDQDNQKLVILFANQPAFDGMRKLSEKLYEYLSQI